MYNPYDPFRMKSAIGMKPFIPQQTPTPTFPTQGTMPRGPETGSIVGDEEDDSPGSYIQEIMKLSKPGPQMTAYQQMLQQSPNRQDYAPTKMGRLAAAFSGFGAGVRDPSQGYAVASAINEQPYATAMQDYGARVGAMRESAGLERQASEDRLKAVTSAQGMGLKYKDYLLKVREQQAKEAMDQSLMGRRAAQTNLDERELKRKQIADSNTVQHQTVMEGLARGDQAIRAAAQRANESFQGRMAGAAEKRAEKTGQPRPPTPATPDQQMDQLQNQLFIARTNPQLGAYISEDKQTGVLSLKPDDGTEKWKLADKEIRRRVQNALKSHSPFGTPDEQDDNDSLVPDEFQIIGMGRR